MYALGTNADENWHKVEDDNDDIYSLDTSILKRDQVDNGEGHELINKLSDVIEPGKFSAHHKRKGHHHHHKATQVPVSDRHENDVVNESVTKGNEMVDNLDDKKDNEFDNKQASAGKGIEDQEESAKDRHSNDNHDNGDNQSDEEQKEIEHEPEHDSHNFAISTARPFDRLHPNPFVKPNRKYIALSKILNIRTRTEEGKGGPLKKLLGNIFRKHDAWKKNLQKNGKGALFNDALTIPTQVTKGKGAFYNDVITIPKQRVTTYQVTDKDTANKGVTEVPGVRTPKTYGFWMFYRGNDFSFLSFSSFLLSASHSKVSLISK